MELVYSSVFSNIKFYVQNTWTVCTLENYIILISQFKLKLAYLYNNSIVLRVDFFLFDLYNHAMYSLLVNGT